jgi:hypothetical protein
VTPKGEAVKSTVLETDVFVKRAGQWLYISHHGSAVPE